MRDSMKMTVKYQFAYILLIRLVSAGIAFLFGAFIFYYLMFTDVAKQILSVALMGVEFAMLYVAAKKFANRDAKTVTPLNYSLLKGVMFGVAIAAINIILILIYTIVWRNFSGEYGVTGAVPIAYNACFYIWTFAYNGLIADFTAGQFGYIASAAAVIVPIAATTVGYIAGGKNFDLTERLDSFIYEKDEDNAGEE